MRNGIEVSASCFQGDARLKTSHKSGAAIQRRPVTAGTHGHVKGRIKRVEMAGHDADQGSRLSLQNKIPAEDFRIAAKFTPPEPVVHDENKRSIRPGILLREGAAKIWRDTQVCKGIAGNRRTRRPIANRFAIIKLKPHTFVSNHVLEHMILVAKAAKLGGKEEVPAFPSTGIREILNSKNNKPLEVPVRQCLDERVVDDAEDDRGSADAESQGEGRDEGEPAIFQEVAEGVAEVAGQTIEVGVHTGKLYTEAARNCRDPAKDEKDSCRVRALYSMA